MDLDRAKKLDENFSQLVLAKTFPSAKSDTLPGQVGLDKIQFLELFDSQLVSRHLDLLARELKEKKLGFYTIGSSGHEGNAAIAKAFKYNDMAFLHYRSSAFIVQRAKYVPDIDIVYDQILSLVASSDDPISGGRHKVFGSVPLFIPPQTSTIASHLPKALGCAMSISLSKTLKDNTLQLKLPKESIILCSFGDASVNHSTAQGAFNATQWIRYAHYPLPLVWICEDNGYGISVPTPPDWIKTIMGNRQGIHYIACDGRNLADVYRAALKAHSIARGGEPVFLHMQTIRLLGHAGADIEFQYRAIKDIEENEKDDPLLHSARIIYEHNWLSPQQIVVKYENVREQVLAQAARAVVRPKLASAKEIMSSLIPPKREITLPALPSQFQREAIFQEDAAKLTIPRNMAQSINMALTDILLQYPNTVVFGEDVAKKGGVYHVTANLQARFGPVRVFDTLLDEQTILGVALGLAHNGFIPIPEIQFLAYTVNAVDQIRGEAATLSFFSKGQYTNPMVLRIPAFAYQKGFGGHFHNDNAIGFLREIPGIIIVCPSTPSDAARLLRKSVELAYLEQRVVIFLEPIALYMVKDYFPGDGLALQTYPALTDEITLGELGIEGNRQAKIAIVSYGNGMYLSRVASKILKQDHALQVKLIDLRWLSPISFERLAKELMGITAVLIVDECRKTGSLSEQLMSWMFQSLPSLTQIQCLTAEDCFIPLGEASQYLLPSCSLIVERVINLAKNLRKG